MRVAYNENGELVYAIKGQELERQAKYFCPRCQQPVQCCQRRDGSYYFRHWKEVQHEGETDIHQQGKIQLCHQLRVCGIEAELEQYERAIDQRPDIRFEWQGRSWVIEYQCSVIPIQEMMERTKALEQLGKKVWWILGKQFLDKDYGDMMQYCVRYHPQLGNFMCLYVQRQWICYHHMQLESDKQRYQYATWRLPLEQIDWHKLLSYYQESGSLQIATPNAYWSEQELQWLRRTPQEEVRVFFQQLYLRKHCVYDLPKACLIKPRYSWSMKSLRLLWTGYIVLWVMEQQPGERITPHQCVVLLEQLIVQRRLRKAMCYHWEEVALQEMEQLFQQLANEGILQARKDAWVIQKRGWAKSRKNEIQPYLQDANSSFKA